VGAEAGRENRGRPQGRGAGRIMRLKRRIFEVVEVAGAGDKLSRAFDVFIVSLITLNVVAIIMETVDPIRRACPEAFSVFEVMSVVMFSAEYALRVWSCTAYPDYSRPIGGRLRFAARPLLVVDLLAVLPFYLPFVGLDLRFLRALRLFRLFRIAKLGRYSTALQTLGRVLVAKKAELGVTLFTLLLLLVVASCMMYYAEADAQPGKFSSIPAAMWWGVATLTTVGYGDVYPVTAAGKAVAAIIAILGIGMFALPAGILGSGFVAEIQRRRSAPRKCPHCGKDVEADS